jgi:hypothetical protein
VPPLVTACFYYWHCELLSIEAHESWKLLLLLSYSMIGLFATYSDLERKKERKKNIHKTKIQEGKPFRS